MRFLRKIMSWVMLVLSVIALVGFFLAMGANVVDPFKAASNYNEYAGAIFTLLTYLSVPFILGMLGLIGITLDRKRED